MCIRDRISAEGKSIFAHDPNGKVAEGYKNLTKEVIKLEKQREKVELAPYDDLFSTEESRQDAKLEKIREIPLSELCLLYTSLGNMQKPS